MREHRADFPIFAHHPEMVYLDTAATAQKPQAVIDAVSRFYGQGNANVHRGLYPLGAAATEAYEGAREKVARFLGVEAREIIFTRGATEGLNLLAWSLSRGWEQGDNIVLSVAEHHANLIPWQQVARERGLELRFLPLDENLRVAVGELANLVDERTRAVSLAHVSNVLGSITPISDVRKFLDGQGSGAALIVDACQSLPHLPLSPRLLGCDFLVFSGHKLYGPSGIGVLWGRWPLLSPLPPYQTGGEMLASSTLLSATWLEAPHKFEAGTPNIEGAIGLGAAVDYLSDIGMEKIARHTALLTSFAMNHLETIYEAKLVGDPDPECGILSFYVEGLEPAGSIHPHDLAQLLGERNVCIRAGHHCAGPLHQELNLSATARISLGLYTTEDDILQFTRTLHRIVSEVLYA